MLVLVDGSLECSKYSTAQQKRANGMDLMEASSAQNIAQPSTKEQMEWI
jgi:hypothetical protein